VLDAPGIPRRVQESAPRGRKTTTRRAAPNCWPRIQGRPGGTAGTKPRRGLTQRPGHRPGADWLDIRQAAPGTPSGGARREYGPARRDSATVHERHPPHRSESAMAWEVVEHRPQAPAAIRAPCCTANQSIKPPFPPEQNANVAGQQHRKTRPLRRERENGNSWRQARRIRTGACVAITPATAAAQTSPFICRWPWSCGVPVSFLRAAGGQSRKQARASNRDPRPGPQCAPGKPCPARERPAHRPRPACRIRRAPILVR